MTQDSVPFLPFCGSVHGEYSQTAAIVACACGCGRPRRPRQPHGKADPKYATDACRAWVRNRAIAAALARRKLQLALPGESRVERRFAEWIDTPPGRYVEAEVLKLALEDRAAGYRRGEINLYLALVRRASRDLTRDRQGYACNNDFRSLLARRLMAAHPGLAGFFETRDLRGVR